MICHWVSTRQFMNIFHWNRCFDGSNHPKSAHICILELQFERKISNRFRMFRAELSTAFENFQRFWSTKTVFGSVFDLFLTIFSSSRYQSRYQLISSRGYQRFSSRGYLSISISTPLVSRGYLSISYQRDHEIIITNHCAAHNLDRQRALRSIIVAETVKRMS